MNPIYVGILRLVFSKDKNIGKVIKRWDGPVISNQKALTVEKQFKLWRRDGDLCPRQNRHRLKKFPRVVPPPFFFHGWYFFTSNANAFEFEVASTMGKNQARWLPQTTSPPYVKSLILDTIQREEKDNAVELQHQTSVWKSWFQS